MKTVKKTEVKKASTKKVTNPAYIVDATCVSNEKELSAAFGIAKQNAGLPMTNEEFNSIIEVITDTCAEVTTKIVNDNFNNLSKPESANTTVKKPNVFKRFWNWVTRKK